MSAPPVIVSNLSKRFGDRVVLDGVCLEVNAGETVALIGPSGGGKTTLLRHINNELRPLFQMIFQDFQLFPHLTALGNIIEAPRTVLKLSKAAALERGMKLLERVGLADRRGAMPHELSGGQKQRVAIARALAMQPKGLLCDEITNALDPELKHEVLAVLEDLRRAGMTLLVVTHELGFARRAADRICVLADGKIIEEGTPEEVLDNPQTERTKQFLSGVLA